MLKEAKFQDWVVDFLRKKKCLAKPLTGSMFMAGMPDIMVINLSNQIFFIEHKRWELKRQPQGVDIFNLLDGPQRNFIPNELWARKVFCPIVAIDVHDEETVHLTTNGEDIFHCHWKTYYTSLL